MKDSNVLCPRCTCRTSDRICCAGRFVSHNTLLSASVELMLGDKWLVKLSDELRTELDSIICGYFKVAWRVEIPFGKLCALKDPTRVSDIDLGDYDDDDDSEQQEEDSEELARELETYKQVYRLVPGL